MSKITIWSKEPGLEGVEEVRPRLMREFIPEWYKNMPRDTVETLIRTKNQTIKTCPSFGEWFNSGIVVPMWTDMVFHTDEKTREVRWQISQGTFRVDIHNDGQFRDHLPIHAQQALASVFKLVCPWRFKTEPGYSLYQMPLIYHFNKDFDIAAGMIRTDQWHEINQQLLMRKYGEVLIKRGTPLACYVPYKRETHKYKILDHFKDIKEIDKLNKIDYVNTLQVRTSFKHGYRLKTKETPSGCPYHRRVNDFKGILQRLKRILGLSKEDTIQ